VASRSSFYSSYYAGRRAVLSSGQAGLQAQAPRCGRIVPLAFHVDYWDHLRLARSFSSKEWTARQYRYFAKWRMMRFTAGLCSTARSRPQRRDVLRRQAGCAENHVRERERFGGINPTNARQRVDLTWRCWLDLNTSQRRENNGASASGFVVLSVVERKNVSAKAESLATDSGARKDARGSRGESTQPIQAVGGWFR